MIQLTLNLTLKQKAAVIVLFSMITLGLMCFQVFTALHTSTMLNASQTIALPLIPPILPPG